MSVYAEVIADSISPEGSRLTTMEIQCHRFVLAEFNTHRAFSRNSASSRAIPLAKQIERVRSDLAMPLSFPAEQRGMQGGEELDAQARAQAQVNWEKAAANAIEAAQAMGEIGVHKSIANRLLEPFMWHRIIVSSVEWENFFEQRCSSPAQPEIRAVADAMRDALNDSTPHALASGEWHLPLYHEEIDFPALMDATGLSGVAKVWARHVSAARCARVSYLTHDGKRDVAEDLALYGRLARATPPHLSPMEHVARPKRKGEVQQGNLPGWVQLRHSGSV